MTLPVASEKSGNDKSGIEGNDRDGIAGTAGIISRADFVMLSIRLGAESSAWATPALIKAAVIVLTKVVSPLDHITLTQAEPAA